MQSASFTTNIPTSVNSHVILIIHKTPAFRNIRLLTAYPKKCDTQKTSNRDTKTLQEQSSAYTLLMKTQKLI